MDGQLLLAYGEEPSSHCNVHAESHGEGARVEGHINVHGGLHVLMQDKTTTTTMMNKLLVVSTNGYSYRVGRRVVNACQQTPCYCDNQSEQKLVHLHMDDPDKHVIHLDDPDDRERHLVTVGTIWNMHKYYPKLICGKRRQNLEDLCLSFSLFKMLQRRFEHNPMVEVSYAMARTVMLDGVLKLKNLEPEGRLQNLFL
ncbi:hypothetical protein GUJ93_ZPchr0010g10020 [Zizania palustris]|uniref:Uncharacterized protein n=1 Tax=Zizania palustris TaxID=103762 RepID=A0A8J6BP82_ZIZPA|nr:hypothetical protein GUJ93_ZPchr0010g10020 [Zizania palustris]